MCDAELRVDVIHLLDWAKTQFRPSSRAYDELDSLAVTLMDADVEFRPALDLRVQRRSAKAIIEEIDRLKETGDLGADFDSASDAMYIWAQAFLQKVDKIVTYEQVMNALRGSWADMDLGIEIRSISDRLKAAEQAYQTPAAPTPAMNF